MTLEEVRVGIDQVDTAVKPLFLKRFECAKAVAEVKAGTGGDVYDAARENVIIDKRSEGVPAEVISEYKTFLLHLMSLSRRYQYGMLTKMQEAVMSGALAAAGLDAAKPHSHVEVSFKAAGNMNLFINMAFLNGIEIESLCAKGEAGVHEVAMTLAGSVNDANVRQYLTQLGKEAADFKIVALN